MWYRLAVLGLLCAAFAGAPGTSRGDEIAFVNGDRLSGKIVSMLEGKVVFASQVAGEVEVPFEQIQTLSTDGSIEIHLNDGTVVRDSVQAADAGTVRTAGGSALAGQVFRLSDAVSINPPPPEPVRWKGNVGAGLNVLRGNSKTQAGSADLIAERRAEINRIAFDGGYRGDRQEDEETGQSITTKRRVFGGLQYDHFVTEKLYWYGNSRAEKDGVSNIDLRLTTGSGLGYQWYEGDDFSFRTEAGLAWVSENFKDNTPDDDYLAARTGWKLDRRLSTSIFFFHDGSWVPSLEDSDDHFVETLTGFRTQLSDAMFFEAKTRWTWDSSPAEDKKRQDIEYILGIGYAFGN